jgi:hypothetical protein
MVSLLELLSVMIESSTGTITQEVGLPWSFKLVRRMKIEETRKKIALKMEEKRSLKLRHSE